VVVAVSLAIAFLPVIAFYAVYRRYSLFLPDYSSHATHFLIGAAAAALLSILGTYVPAMPNFWLTGALRAAVPERTLVFIILCISPLVRSPSRTVTEKIAAGILTGLGFATVENIGYGFADGVRIVFSRLLLPVPLHASLCAFTAHRIAIARLFRHRLSRYASFAAALLVPLVLHILVDSMLLGGAPYGAGILVAFLLVGLEYAMARAQMIPPLELLDALEMKYEDWLLAHEQQEYDRWLMLEHGAGFQPEPLFVFRLSVFRMTAILFLLLIPTGHLLLLSGINLGLSQNEQRTIFILFPLFLAANVALVGQINPDYFRYGQIRIPMQINVTLDDQIVETAFSIHSFGCFLKTAEALTLERASLRFRQEYLQSPFVKGVISWQNHKSVRRQFGSTLFIRTGRPSFLYFVARIHLRQFFSGLRYRLRLPGFQDLTALFLRPEGISRDTRLFSAGTILFEEGEPGQTFFLIKKGTVLVYRSEHGVDIDLARLGPGELFGEMALAGKMPRNASARCITDCVLAIGERESLDRLIRSNTEFARQLIELSAARFHSTAGAISHRIDRIERDQLWERILDYAGVVLLLEGMGVSGPDFEIPLNLNSGPIEREILLPILKRLTQRRPRLTDIPVKSRKRAVEIYKMSSLRFRVSANRKTDDQGQT